METKIYFFIFPGEFSDCLCKTFCSIPFECLSFATQMILFPRFCQVCLRSTFQSKKRGWENVNEERKGNRTWVVECKWSEKMRSKGIKKLAQEEEKKLLQKLSEEKSLRAFKTCFYCLEICLFLIENATDSLQYQFVWKCEQNACKIRTKCNKTFRLLWWILEKK